MAQLEETNYDIIIVGTGMVESMLGGALTRAGKTVLQLDPNDYYGGQYRTLSLSEINSMFQSKLDHQQTSVSITGENTVDETTENKDLSYQDAYRAVNCSYQYGPEPTLEEYLTSREARRFNIDLVNKLIYSNVNLVPLLVKSSVGRYMEFKLIDSVQLFIADQGSFQRVPCTKGEIMSNSFISRMDKLYLGKFLKFCLEYQQSDENSESRKQISSEQSFIQFLRKSHKLSTVLENFIVYAIAMLDSKDECVSAAEGMKRIERYMNSLGKYGNSAFLYPMYGISELSQAFCRVGAVYSGTYVLRRGVQSLSVNNDSSTQEVTGVVCTEKQALTCGTLILNNDYRLSDSSLDTENCEMISRRVVLTTFRIVADDDGAHIAILPPGTISEKQTTAITIVQLSQRSATAPKDCFVISFQMRSKIGEHQAAQEVMNAAVQRFLYEKREKLNNQYTNEQNEQKEDQDELAEEKAQVPSPVAKIIYDVHYTQYVRDPSQNELSQYSNVFVCKDADIYLDMEDTVSEAKAIFYKLCGEDLDFIEKLPDPEENLTNQIIDEDARMLGIDQQSIQQQEILQEESFSENATTSETPTENAADATNDAVESSSETTTSSNEPISAEQESS